MAGCVSYEEEEEVYTSSVADTIGTVIRLDDRIDTLVPADAVIEKLAEGFEWSEGPVWVPDEGGYLLFSDIPVNTIYRWDEKGGLSPYLRPAGYAGSDPSGAELGTNGLMLDAEGRLVMCDHGNRQVARLNTTNFTRETIASAYEGKRLNSPNDLAFHSSGDLYFTDPPYGLSGLNDSPDKELPFNGVYRVDTSGEVSLLTEELGFPNGIAFSPDEKTLYVANSGGANPVIRAYDVQDDGTLANSRVFFDGSALIADGAVGAFDGMALDTEGNLFATGPGGVLVLTPEGEHLGTISTGERIANCTFGDDGSTLYLTSDMLLARIRLDARGLGF
ncbi:MAG: SMP-30/gluconolactonase/LRE family protein [Bacteroidetes bacterium SB0662_bin_6]|nr:SMP-30/gluconolactonase/LRE family protein [Bacteroidetes bacterium SB0668_bin_1]MYE04035.1 SMP-30/gluconolactonase/LRE family protein [Bacteroidetes bacterium SB0662_bin_6]